MEQVRVERLDHLGVIASVIKDLGLIAMIDTRLVPDAQEVITPGEAVAAERRHRVGARHRHRAAVVAVVQDAHQVVASMQRVAGGIRLVGETQLIHPVRVRRASPIRTQRTGCRGDRSAEPQRAPSAQLTPASEPTRCRPGRR